MIAARRQRPRVRGMDLGEETLDAVEARIEIERVDRRIAAIAAPDAVERRDAGDMMNAPDQARLVADLARSVARAGEVGGAAIEGYTDKRDIDFIGPGDRQAHEGRQPRKARHEA